MKKEYILITGATGFIGSHVAQKFLEDKHYHVIAITRRIKGHKNIDKLKKTGIILFEGLFYDKDDIHQVFTEYPIQHVVHMAALRGVGGGSKEDYRKVNVVGTEVLLEAAMAYRVKKFIFCSSVGVFGTIPVELPAGLDTALHGDNLYHRSKIEGEAKVQEFIDRGLDAYIVRPSITYGDGDTGFPSILMRLVNKRLLMLPAKDIKIHLLQVGKLAEVIKEILIHNKLKERTFIIADKDPVSLHRLVNLIHNKKYYRDYPSFLKMPGFVFKSLLACFRIARNEKWMTRLLLISKSWYFDISNTVKTIQYLPAKTEEDFIREV